MGVALFLQGRSFVSNRPDKFRFVWNVCLDQLSFQIVVKVCTLFLGRRFKRDMETVLVTSVKLGYVVSGKRNPTQGLHLLG